MTKEQLQRIDTLQEQIDDTYFIMGRDCISTEYMNELFEKVQSLEAQMETIEREGKNFCEVCDIEVEEEVIDKYHKAYCGEELYCYKCNRCNKFDPMEL